jgi:Fe-S cluster biosynthesis and repair protein YggX
MSIQDSLMPRNVFCLVLQNEAEGLERPPHPGELGQRIYQHISREGWQQWLQRLAAIMNENRLSTADPKTLELIEQHMVGFLFNEGDLGHLPSGFTPQGKGK